MHLHLDCQFGMAGDMLLAALVDAGADVEAIRDTLRNIPLEGFRLEISRTARGGVAATLADVIDSSQGGPAHDHEHDHDHDHDHGHDHDHVHDHAHEHDPEQRHRHGHSHRDEPPGKPGGANRPRPSAPGPHRHLADLMAFLEAPVLSPRVRERAGKTFRIIAEAEAAVHGQAVDSVHFHEISGIDTAVDVIGSCLALELLEVSSISASPPAAGSGMVMCDHGIFPIPAPATLEIFKRRNIPWIPGGEGERTTPTGAALLAALADTFGHSPEITVTRIGYGAGHREYQDVPNLLRAIVGKIGRAEDRSRPDRDKPIIADTQPEFSGDIVKVPVDESLLPAGVASLLPGEPASEQDRVVEFRFVVDDMTPEALGFLFERCFSAGAIEAYAVAAIMKKGRPGHEVTVLATNAAAREVAEVLWNESSTFGMRVGEKSRLVLPRETRAIKVLGHTVRVKVGWRGGRIVRREPEYEDCREAALALMRPIREVFALACEKARREIPGE